MATDWRTYLKLGNGSFAMQTMLSQLEVARRKGKIAWNSEDTIGADVERYAKGRIARIPYDARSFGMGDVGTEDEDKVILGSLYDQLPVQVARKIGGVDYTRTKAEVISGAAVAGAGGGGGGGSNTITIATYLIEFYIDGVLQTSWQRQGPVAAVIYMGVEAQIGANITAFSSLDAYAKILNLTINGGAFNFFYTNNNSIIKEYIDGGLTTYYPGGTSDIDKKAIAYSIPLTIEATLAGYSEQLNNPLLRAYTNSSLQFNLNFSLPLSSYFSFFFRLTTDTSPNSAQCSGSSVYHLHSGVTTKSHDVKWVLTRLS